MTELESLRAERDRLRQQHSELAERAGEVFDKVQDCIAQIAELEREPQRWLPKDGRHWYVGGTGNVSGGDTWDRRDDDFNAFPTEARAQEVATHFKRLGLAAQWGALLTTAAAMKVERLWRAEGETWSFIFPAAAQRDGFMEDAKREGLL